MLTSFLRAGCPVTLLAIGLLSLPACHRDEVQADGALSATILPAGYVTQVTATDADAHVYTATPDVSTGTVRFSNLPAGTYTFAVATKLAYKTPEVRRVQVMAGQTTTLPSFTLTRDAKLRGTLSWTENGTRYAASTLYGEVSGTLVSVDGAVLSNGTSREVAFVIPVRPIPGQAVSVFTGPGTYALGEQEWTFGKYVRTSGADAATWYTPSTGASTGHVTVTQYDPASFTLAGTFAFTARPFANATGTPSDITITDGTGSKNPRRKIRTGAFFHCQHIAGRDTAAALWALTVVESTSTHA